MLANIRSLGKAALKIHGRPKTQNEFPDQDGGKYHFRDNIHVEFIA
jgi:hypothetical protein